MKINHVNTHSQSFGLKISNTAGFNKFIEKTKSPNWGCSDEDIANFTKELENMHFAKEAKNDTTIMFGVPIKEIAEVRQVPCPAFKRPYREETIYITRLPYSFKKTNGEKSNDNMYSVPLNGSSLNDILAEIASDYAKFTYGE